MDASSLSQQKKYRQELLRVYGDGTSTAGVANQVAGEPVDWRFGHRCL
jgi:hypothetical protein